MDVANTQNSNQGFRREEIAQTRASGSHQHAHRSQRVARADHDDWDHEVGPKAFPFYTISVLTCDASLTNQWNWLLSKRPFIQCTRKCVNYARLFDDPSV